MNKISLNFCRSSAQTFEPNDTFKRPAPKEFDSNSSPTKQLRLFSANSVKDKDKTPKQSLDLISQNDPLKHRKIDPLILDCLNFDNLLEIVKFCDNTSLLNLLLTTTRLYFAAKMTLCKRLTQKSTVEQVYHEKKKQKVQYIQKVLYRMQAFRHATKNDCQEIAFQLPGDMLHLNDQVTKFYDFKNATLLEKYLDFRDNLIFWSHLEGTNLDHKKQTSLKEYREAYEALNKTGFLKKNLAKTEFDLSNLRLTSIPPDLLKYFGITSLNMSHNFITAIPEELANKLTLNDLDMSNNSIQEIPASICELRLIQKLSLNNNHIQKIPESIYRLHNLVRFEISHNFLHELILNFSILHQLEYLDLSNNQFVRLPTAVCMLKSLKTLKLSSNPFIETPYEIGNLSELEFLDIKNTGIDELGNSIRF